MTFEYALSSRFGPEPSDPVREFFSMMGRGDVISFAGGIPDSALFEVDDLRACFDHVLTAHPRRALQYGTAPGEHELREAAASVCDRYLPTTADQIQVTSGAQEGIFLAAQALVSPGAVVLVEDPTYTIAIQAFRLSGARLVGVASDDEGMVPDALAGAIAEHAPAFVYLVPTFSNPTGRCMSAERRRAVADILLRTGVVLVEDDPYGRLRFEGEEVDPIAALPGMSAQTILLNSVSKTISPGLRIGWMRAEGGVHQVLQIAKGAVTMQSPALNQLVVAHYLTHYDVAAHVRRVVACYRPRRDAMYSGLASILPPTASVTRPAGGMFCWVELRDGSDAGALLATAVAEGVAFVPGWSFYAGEPDRATLRLSFVTNPEDRITEGLRRLGAALAS